MDSPWGLNWTVIKLDGPDSWTSLKFRAKFRKGNRTVSYTFRLDFLTVQFDYPWLIWFKWLSIYLKSRSLSPPLTVHFRPGLFWWAYLFHSVHKWSFHTILCEVRPTVPPVIEFALFQSVYYYSPNLTRQLFRPSISNMFHPFRDRILNLFVNKSQNNWLVSNQITKKRKSVNFEN